VLIQPIVAAYLGLDPVRRTDRPAAGPGAAVTLGGVVLAQWASREA
jgi:hypothetical protein